MRFLSKEEGDAVLRGTTPRAANPAAQEAIRDARTDGHLIVANKLIRTGLRRAATLTINRMSSNVKMIRRFNNLWSMP